jgi:hypothetical protein
VLVAHTTAFGYGLKYLGLAVERAGSVTRAQRMSADRTPSIIAGENPAVSYNTPVVNGSV